MKNVYLKTGISVMAILAMLVACQNDKKIENKERGIIISNMDTSISPKEDFYNYVNGSWMKNTEIPDDQVRWGGFGVLRKSTAADVLAIIENSKESGAYAPETDQAKALAIFTSKLDTIARDASGIEPLKPALAKIASITNVADFQRVWTENAVTISQPFMGIAAFSNPSNSAMNAAYIAPGGLGLPDETSTPILT
jgi:putative endopeptidase